MLSALSPSRRRLVVVVAALLGVVVLAGGLTYGLSRRGSDPRAAVAATAPGPVVLVPGYGGSQTAVDTLAATLRAHGRRASVLTLPDGGTGDLRAQAEALRTLVTTVLRTSGAASVDVVGYSAGGVVTRLWVKSYGGSGQARRVVTLGAPQHGTELAELGAAVPGACTVACQQLVPGSSLLAGLNQGRETPSGPQFVSIWTTDDQTVVPADSARLAGSTGFSVQSVCAGTTVSHSDLPRNAVVQAMVLAELDGARMRALGAADCTALRT